MKSTADPLARMMSRLEDFDEFPACIECAADHLSRTPTLFHTRRCKHGAGLSDKELTRRLQARFDFLQRKSRHTPKLIRCTECANPPTGTGWIAYHDFDQVLVAFPLCDEHSAFEDDDGRPCGFIPGLVTTLPFAVELVVFSADFDSGAQSAAARKAAK